MPLVELIDVAPEIQQYLAKGRHLSCFPDYIKSLLCSFTDRTTKGKVEYISQ